MKARAWTLLASGVLGACSQAPNAGRTSSLAFAAAKSIATLPAGSVRGRVEFDGTPPARLPLATSATDGCGASGAARLSETLVVEEGGISNVLVHVKSARPSADPAPSAALLLDQSGCTFVPHVVALRVGQTLAVRNDDSTTHNVNVRPARAANEALNKMQPPGAEELELRFAQPELAIPVRCDVHPWMAAWVHVLDHPYFAVSSRDGSFEIAGLAPGHHELEVVHEWLGRSSFEFDLPASNGVELTIRLRASSR